jgi:hypothetical protein
MSTEPLIYVPGSACPISGKYAVVWIATRKKTGDQLSILNGEKFPITVNEGQGYVLISVLGMPSEQTHQSR